MKTMTDTRDDFLTLNKIKHIVAGHLRIDVSVLESDYRGKPDVTYRQAAMWMTKTYTSCSLKFIGFHFGKDDHATVIYAIKTINNLINTDRKFRYLMIELKEAVECKLYGMENLEDADIDGAYETRI